MRCMSSLPTECPDMVSPDCPEYRVMPAVFQGIRSGVPGMRVTRRQKLLSGERLDRELLRTTNQWGGVSTRRSRSM